ncbi:lactonase family protein [Allostreptomyces psammosilenae]|uniref:6-phosphogluconolactonase (Cycloisomerase 2 family) n=1 Tax=Allostreptomyces psammosilenae TaxID=1892865 RepID=A0A852ZTD3_9ACTN|nr:lactonase family protein [Allostreptomyces psammosilenae]NYI05105.1 6-phosphogluconolactonase (cycloisomerase 2 family) [Allostreptomyces psammosilenae]
MTPRRRQATAEHALILLGRYTDDPADRPGGIDALRPAAPGRPAASAGTLAHSPDASWLTRHPRLPVLYAVREQEAGAVVAYREEADGSLEAIGEVSSRGGYPCHLAASPDGRWLAVANYGDGVFALLPLDDAGRPGPAVHTLRSQAPTGPHPDRQDGPHAHMVCFLAADPTGRTLATVDLGTDEVLLHTVTEDGRTRPAGGATLPPGTGPRHLAEHPDGRLFVVGELDSTVTELRPAPPERPGQDWRLAVGRAVPATLRAPDADNYPAAVRLSADARTLYVSNRGADCVTSFAVTADGPRPLADTAVGAWPRDLLEHAGHLYSADQNDGAVTVLRLDAASGVPEPTGTTLPAPGVACLLAPRPAPDGPRQGEPGAR